MNTLAMPSVFSFTKLDGSAIKVRTAIRKGEEWFVVKDVCDALGLQNVTEATAYLGKKEKEVILFRNSEDDTRHLFKAHTSKLVLISESGLYKLIMRSTKPDARPFQNWVTKVVLPSLRKDGAYVQGEEKVISGEMSEEELLLKAMTILNRKVERLAQERDELKAANVSLTPKASAYDLIFDQDGLVRLSEVQKAIRVRDTRINLNAMTPDLIRMGWLYREETGVPTGHREGMTRFRVRFQFGG